MPAQLDSVESCQSRLEAATETARVQARKADLAALRGQQGQPTKISDHPPSKEWIAP